MAAGWRSQGDAIPFVATRTTTYDLVYGRPYVQKRATQTNFIYCPAVCLTGAAPNFTVRTGPQKRRSRPRTSPLNPKPFSSTRCRSSFRGCCHQPCTTAPCERCTGMYFRLLREFLHPSSRKSLSRARGEAYWKQWHSSFAARDADINSLTSFTQEM